MSFIDNLITNTIRADVRAAGTYSVPDASGFIKLDAMITDTTDGETGADSTGRSRKAGSGQGNLRKTRVP